MTSHPSLFWQLGFVVADLEAAMDELGRALGLEWRQVRRLSPGGFDIRVVLSQQGPPYFELCEGPPGSPWDGSGGSRVDHIAYWVDDDVAERRRLEAAGAPVVWDGKANGSFVDYHDAPAAGIRLEPIGRGHLERISAGWGGLDALESLLPFAP